MRTIKTVFGCGDVETLKRLMTEDHMATLSYARFSNRADQLKVLGEFKISAYEIEGLKVKALTGSAALASFQANIKGSYKGKEVPSPVQVMEVWIRRDGKWLQASYQETPIGEK